ARRRKYHPARWVEYQSSSDCNPTGQASKWKLSAAVVRTKLPKRPCGRPKRRPSIFKRELLVSQQIRRGSVRDRPRPLYFGTPDHCGHVLFRRADHSVPGGERTWFRFHDPSAEHEFLSCSHLHSQ